MKKFKTVLAVAEKRKGSSAELKKWLPKVKTDKQVAKVGDDRMLAMMAKTVNQAGFSWKVIENKWPQFEEAFFAFDVHKLSLLSPEQWENYVKDKRVVRNWQKIKAVKDNVVFILQEARDSGSFAKFIAGWPSSDLAGLLQHLKKHGSRLGGNTGQRFLRYVGKDGFILSSDVVIGLQQSGIDIADNPTSKRDFQKIQEAFNSWHDETNLPYAHLSKILSCSVGKNYSLAEIGH